MNGPAAYFRQIRKSELKMRPRILTATILSMATVMLPFAVFGQQQASQEVPETIAENYRLTLKVEDDKGADVVISSMVTEGTFSFTTVDPECWMEGTVRRQNDASLVVRYRLRLYIRVPVEGSHPLNREVSLSSRVRLELNEPATIFDTKSRTFTLSLARID